MCRPGSEKGTLTNWGHSEKCRGRIKSPEHLPGALRGPHVETQLSFREVRGAGEEGQTLTPPHKVPVTQRPIGPPGQGQSGAGPRQLLFKVPRGRSQLSACPAGPG